MKGPSDLDSIIENFQKIKPSENQLSRWESILRSRRPQPKYYLAAGLAAGLILGILSTRAILVNNQSPAEEFSATFIQHSVKNL